MEIYQMKRAIAAQLVLICTLLYSPTTVSGGHLDLLPYRFQNSELFMSNDGRAIAFTLDLGEGSVNGENARPARWTPLQGLQILSDEPGRIKHISGDGATALGFVLSDEHQTVLAWRAGGAKTLQVNDVAYYGVAGHGGLTISDDGRRVLGRAIVNGFNRAVLMDIDFESGLVQSTILDHTLGVYPAISGDGLSAIGADLDNRFVRLTFGEEPTLIPDSFPDNLERRARSLSYDGRAAVLKVGFGTTWYWSEQGGLVRLSPEGWTGTHAADISGDGTVAAFQAVPPNDLPDGAFIWDQVFGVRPLVDVLGDRGVAIPAGVNVFRADSVSDNGLYVAGAYLAGDTQARIFRAYLGVGQTLGDTDNDGDVDLADLNNVRNNFGGAGLGDTEGNGTVDLSDLNNVRNHFGESVPVGNPVPEPAAFALSACFGLALAIQYLRRSR